MTTRPSLRAPDPRREETRQRLVQAGLELFSRYGFDGVTTRELAQRAGTNQAAIPYHFGGKEGVYLAVAQYIIEQARPRLDPVLSHIQERLPCPAPDALSKPLAGELLEEFLAGLSRAMLTEPLPSQAFAFLYREQFQPSAAFDLLYQELLRPPHELCGLLVAGLLGQPVDSRTTIHAEHALLGLVSAFVSTRSSLERRLGQADLDSGEIEQSLRRLLSALAAGA